MNRSKEASVFGPNMELAPFSEYTHTPTLGKLSEIYEKRLSNEGLGSCPRKNSPALPTVQVAACLGQTGSAESRYRTDVCKRYDFGVVSTTRASNRRPRNGFVSRFTRTAFGQQGIIEKGSKRAFQNGLRRL